MSILLEVFNEHWELLAIYLHWDTRLQRILFSSVCVELIVIIQNIDIIITLIFNKYSHSHSYL